jgi:hypothetical protein
MTARIVDLVGCALRKRGKQCGKLWREYCRAGAREAAKAAFLEAVACGYVPPEIIVELETVKREIVAAVDLASESVRVDVPGSNDRRARLIMRAQGLGYALELLRARVSCAAVAAT